jgi:hypothetical protein
MKQLIERKRYMQILRNLKNQNLIKVITGVRRCGKSTLLQMFADELLENGVTENQIQFYNFEDPDVFTIGNWKDIYDHIKVRLLPDKMNYIFLDEVQNIDTFQRLVDGLFIKENCDVYITGSNAYLLSGELATLLTGRYIETSILPLPIPGLDGGYFLFILVEMITRKKPSDKFLERANTIGFILLITLLVWANGLDVFRLFK